LERSYQEALKKGIRVRSLVVINPGNPTGAIFSPETIKKIISFCVNKRILIIADEVYRENIYKEGAQFYSFRKVLNTMEPKYR
jgi:alanine transaminase